MKFPTIMICMLALWPSLLWAERTSASFWGPELTDDVAESVPDLQLAGRDAYRSDDLPSLSLTGSNNRPDTRWGADASLGLMSMPFPMAKGIEVYYRANRNWRLGLAYHQSSIALNLFFFDVGDIKEEDYTLRSRFFPGNQSSFNFLMGIGHRRISLNLARNLFDLALENYSLMVSELQSTTLVLGLGNEWRWKNHFLLSVDWLTLNAVIDGRTTESASRFAKDEESRKDIKRAENILSWVPSGGFLGVSFGLRF